MKLRQGDPWIPAVEYSRSLSGFSVNLLVADVGHAARFATAVFKAETIYADPDFAVLRHESQEWMLHADHSYEQHPHAVRATSGPPRGLGVELRIHHCDPDKAAETARGLGCEVISEPRDMGHGLREAFILDFDGYTWVVDEFIGPKAHG